MAYASITYTSASGTTFALTNSSGNPIQYLRQADISVTVNGVLKTLTTDYTFNAAGTAIVLNTAVSGATVVLSRTTSITDATVSFTAGSTLTAQDLNNSDKQNRFALQEFSDTYGAITTGTGDLSILGGFIGSAETWLSDNSHAATTGAIDGRVDSKIDTALTTDVVAGNAITITDNSPSSGQITVAVTNGAIETAELADNAVTTAKIADGNVTTAKILDSNVTTAKIADSNVTTAKINNAAVTEDKLANSAVTNAKIASGAIDSTKLSGATVVTNSEVSAVTVNDTSFFTTSASDLRYFRQDSSEAITSGDAWSSSDSYVATTAAIDARIVDLVDDVGGFVPIANETSFPATNPDINNPDGAGTIISIKEIVTTRTPSSGTVTIANGSGSNTVTINGCGSTVLASGFGVLVETTSTLHTYTFHRLVPKATEVTTVAGISTQITTVSNNVSDITTVANDLNEPTSEIETVAGSIANVDAVGGSIANVNTVASNLTAVNSFANLYRIASSDPTTSLDTGDLVFNTTSNRLRIYNGTAWQDGVTATGDLVSRTGDTMTGALGITSGSAGSPSLFISGDTNTGIYSPGADQVAISTGGSGRLFVDSSGNVGINTTSPNSLLTLFNTTSTDASEPSLTFGNNTFAGQNPGCVKTANGGLALEVQSPSTGTFQNRSRIRLDGGSSAFATFSFSSDNGSTYNSEALRITSDGKLGLGTSNPSELLEVSADPVSIIKVTAGTSGSNSARRATLKLLAGGSKEFNLTADASDSSFKILDSTTPRVTIDSSGRVGIGTSSPSQLLTVKGTQSFEATNSTNAWLQYTYTDNSLRFNYNGAGADEIVITSGGNVGIGTTSPGGMLQVEGGVFGRSFEFHTSGISPTHGVTITSPSANNLAFRTSSNEAARFDSSGRLLVGTSSDSLGSTIVAQGNSSDSSGLGIVRACCGTASPANNQELGAFTFGDSGHSSSATVVGKRDGGTWTSGSSHPSRLEFSTTADGASSPTERMRIDSNGKVKINTTTTSYAAANSIIDVSSAAGCITATTSAGSLDACIYCHNTATSGDNVMLNFGTEGTWTSRGSVTYNRGGGVIAYNTTSDYRSKTLLGSIENPGDTIDAFKVYRGMMNGATIERPMLVAHEAQEVAPYCVTGEKDAVDVDGNPIYQQMDHQVLVPLLIAEIQQLRARVAALEAS